MTTKLGYMAIDERHGDTYHLKTMHPRKELMERLGYKSARKMFTDTKSGDTKHVGYVIGPHWCQVYEVHALS